MKNVEQAEEFADLDFMFAPESFGSMVPASGIAEDNSTTHETPALDMLLAGLKWTFLFVPGAIWVHMIVMTSALLLPRFESPQELLLQGGASLVLAAFLIMFGLGKLRDLKYLSVVGTIFASSVIFSIISIIAGLFFRGEMFTWIFLCSMPLTIAVGQLTKLSIDRSQR